MFSWFTLEAGTDIGDVLAGHVLSVYFEDFVSGKEPGLVGGCVDVGLTNNDVVFIGTHADDGTNTGVFTGSHEFEFFEARFRVVFGVGIQGTKHGIDAGLYHFFGVGIVDIEGVDVAEKGGEYVEGFADFESFVIFFEGENPNA